MKPQKKTLKSQLYTLLKIATTAALLYFVFTKIPFQHVWQVLKSANVLWLFVALCCFLASQWVSAKRLLRVFYAVDFKLSEKLNNILYLIGMFYNFFIPGGIGGDAYKVYFLNKNYDWSLKKLSSAVLLDRFMGLVAIGILVVLLSGWVPFVLEHHLLWLLPLLIIGGIVASYIFVKRVFPSYKSIFTITLLQSLVVQLLQCLCVVFVLMSLNDLQTHTVFYVLVFLVSSVLSIFSFSGIGIRELVFYQAATYFVFDSTVAVTVGLLFSFMTAIVSLFGIIFHIRGVERYIKS